MVLRLVLGVLRFFFVKVAYLEGPQNHLPKSQLPQYQEMMVTFDVGNPINVSLSEGALLGSSDLLSSSQVLI